MSTYEFKLPDVGEGLSEGEIVKWHVAVGDVVKADQIIVDVQTDKAIVEIPSPVNGTITALGGAPNDVIAIGALLATIETTDTVAARGAAAAPAPSGQTPAAPEAAKASGASPPPASSSPASSSPAPAAQASEADSADAPVASPSPASSTQRDAPSAVAAAATSRPGRALASPATRKLARTLGIDLTTLEGTGSRGQITRQDVERAHAAPAESAAAPEAAPASTPVRRAPVRREVDGEDRVEPLKGLRRQVAQSMQEAWNNIPHIFSMDDLDATELVRARAMLNDELAPAGIKISYMPFLIKACVAALEQHPRFNASLDMDKGQIIYKHRINIGVATATPEGLIVTVVHDADTKSMVEIAEQIASMAELARNRKIGLAQLTGGTFTISNYGSYGGMMGTPIIRPPEVAIAGFGRLHEAVVPVDGVPAVRTRLPFCVATDHRLNDGEHVGAFIDVMSRNLAQPVRLLGRTTWS